MENNYAIAIFNKEEDYIVKPFFSNIPKIEKLIIISDKNSIDDEKKRILLDFLNTVNIKYDFIYLNDITNFFQVYFIVSIISLNEGNPVWVNASCGSGIGMAALTLHAVKNNIKIILYEKESNRTSIVDIKKLQKINLFDLRYLNIIKELNKGNNTISMLAKSLNIDKSVVSRRLANLLSIEIIKKIDNPKKIKPYIFCLTEFGKLILEISNWNTASLY